MANVQKIGAVVVGVALGGTAIAGALVGQNTNANSLEPKAVAALQNAGITGVSVSFKGREAYLVGQGTTDAQLQQAKQVVESVYGVRWATVTGDAQPSTPAPEPTAPTTTASPTPPTEAPTPTVTPTETPTATPTETPTATPTETPTATPTPSPTTATSPSPSPGTPLTPDQIAQINATVINFANGTYSLGGTAMKNLDAVIPLLANSNAKVEIDGYVSLPHPAGREIADSKRRADTVAKYLESHGVDASRITVVGRGTDNPIASNDTAAGQAANRRATLTVS